MNRTERAMMVRMGLLLLAALGLAMAIMLLPLAPVEALIGASGFDEMVPAAAPPLGMTARAIVALAVSLTLFLFGIGPFVVRGAARPIRPRAARAARSEGGTIAAKDSGGVLGWLRDRMDRDPASAGDGEAPPPRLRAADRHPDAPARAPLRAGRDLADTEPLPPPLPEGEVPPVAIRRGIAQPADGAVTTGATGAAGQPEPAPGDLLALADRLASAIDTHGAAARARLMSRRTAPVPPPPIPPKLDESLDEALDAALRTLDNKGR